MMRCATRVTALLTASWALLAPALASPVLAKTHGPGLETRTALVLSNITHFGADAPTRKMYTRDDVVAGIRRRLPDERVVQGADLADFLAANSGKLNCTILVEDTSAVIDMSTVQTVQPPSSDSAAGKWKRMVGPVPTCRSYTSYTSSNNAEAWTAWFPASACEYTGLDPNGGSTSVSYAFGLAYSETFSISYTVLETISYGFSFGITESYTESASFGCNIPGESVGQVWFQGWAGYSSVSGQNCIICSEGGGPSCSGGSSGNVGFPEAGNFQLGCSVGGSNVNCAAATSWNVFQSSP